MLKYSLTGSGEVHNSLGSLSCPVNLIACRPSHDRGLRWAVLNRGKRFEGIDHLSRSLELSPSNVHAITDLATAFLILGNTEKAREYGEKARSLDPGYVLAQNLLKTIDRIKGKGD